MTNGSARHTAAASVVCLLAAVMLPTLSDPDLWGHLRFGLDVLRDGHLAVVDPYSFTQDRPQLYHEWLGAVLLAFVYRHAGIVGVQLLKFAICAAAFGVFVPRLRRLSPTDACLVAFLIAWSIIPIAQYVRPQLWSMLAVLLLVRLLQDRRLWWIPPLFAIWANLHGGWVMGVSVLGTWSAATVVEVWWTRREIDWQTMAVGVVAIVATIANPYGWQLWRFLAHTVGLSRSDIADWQPLLSSWDVSQIPIAVTVALLLAVSWTPRTRPWWGWLAVCAVLVYGSLRVSRVAYIATPAIILIILPSLVEWLPSPKPASPPSWRPTVAAAVALLLAAAVMSVRVVSAFQCMPIKGEWIPDSAAIPVLQRGIDGGRVVTYFDWGEYAFWHLGPRLKVSMDGRRETLYSEELLAIHYAIYDNDRRGDDWLLSRRPEYVWLKAKHAGRRDWLATHHYRIDWQSDESYIAVRDDLPPLSGPRTAASSGCFPGP
jgi:hypothetical protein